MTEWWDDSDAGGPGVDVPEQRGGPAYMVSFGWLPSQLPPPSSSASTSSVSAFPIPAPRRAPDDLPRGGGRR